MNKSSNFKGKIFFSADSFATKKTLMSYYAEPLEMSFDQTIMSSFDFLNLNPDEKKQLSSRHRKMLNNYRHINPFALNVDAQEFVESIAKCKSDKIIIHANDYGAYICLAALYSGKIPSDKKIEFHFESSPLALFPKTFLKNTPKTDHKIVFHVQEDSWLGPFSTLYSNDKIKCFYRPKAA
nr:hypothetical protein BHI3_26870 [Bacteriovorax sp. HI3]